MYEKVLCGCWESRRASTRRVAHAVPFTRAVQGLKLSETEGTLQQLAGVSVSGGTSWVASAESVKSHIRFTNACWSPNG